MSKKGQWVPVSFRMARDGLLSTNAKVVHMAIKTYYPNAYPSIELLMKHTGLSRSSVIRAIKELETKGYLKVVRVKGRSNRYEMHYFPLDPDVENNAPEQCQKQH